MTVIYRRLCLSAAECRHAHPDGADVVGTQTPIVTILSYARLYDGTVATDYYRVINDVERQLELVPTPEQPHTEPGQLVALVDALSGGTLNDSQR